MFKPEGLKVFTAVFFFVWMSVWMAVWNRVVYSGTSILATVIGALVYASIVLLIDKKLKLFEKE